MKPKFCKYVRSKALSVLCCESRKFSLAVRPDRLRGAYSIYRPGEVEVVRKSASRASELK